jgi:hypothetical protein
MLKAFVLRYWPLAVLCVFVIAILAMSRYAEDRKNSNKDGAHQSSPAASISPDDAGKTGKDTDEPKHPPSWIDTFAWPEGATVWALFLTLFVIAWQSAETREAAKAAQLSAEATAEQSKNMMAQERARLWIKFPPDDPSDQGMIIQDVDGAQSVPLKIILNIINDGESKAFNVAASGYVRMEDMQAGQIWPSYGDKLKIPKVIRKATLKKPVKISLSQFEFMTDRMVPKDDWNDVKEGKRPLHIVGTISYDDVFGNAHRTPFHYEWNVRVDENWGNEAEWTDHSFASD